MHMGDINARAEALATELGLGRDSEPILVKALRAVARDTLKHAVRHQNLTGARLTSVQSVENLLDAFETEKW
jgi:hypothetical protein